MFSNSGCGVMKTMFLVDEPAALEAEAITDPTSCPDSEDGTIDLTVLGGTLPYTYAWSTGSTDEDITVAGGTYTVEITDANGCTMAPQEYVVGAGEGPEASISVQSSTVMVDDEVAFFSASDLGLDHSWDFGDGATSSAAEPVHSYTLPGLYTVTLTVDDGDCASTTTIEISVESTTGLATIVGPRYNAWVSGDQFIIDHAFDNGEPVLVRIFSTAGQLVQEHRFAGHPARLTLSNSELANGVWLVRVSNGNNARTFSLPVVK
ncbi:MAG: PKD domain-containing protein [Flavobacteriales bacterium]